MYADCACPEGCGCEAIVSDEGDLCEDCLLESCSGEYPPGPAKVKRWRRDESTPYDAITLYDGTGAVVVSVYATEDGYGADGSLSGDEFIRRLAAQMLPRGDT